MTEKERNMSGFEKRLAELGVTLPDAPAPAANYVPWVVLGDMVYVSGQVSMQDGAFITGKLGDDMSVEDGAAAARACAISLLAQVKAAGGGDLDRLKRVVKLTGFVNSTADFGDQPKVINGASDFLVEALGDAGRHTRSAVSAAQPAVRRRGRDRRDLPARHDLLRRRFSARAARPPRVARWPRAGRKTRSPRCAAAVERGYGIEIDVQPSADGVAMVFHDYALDRLTDETGPVRARTRGRARRDPRSPAATKASRRLRRFLTPSTARCRCSSRSRTRTARWAPNVGPLEAAAARDLAGYAGPVAVMSFNPHAVAAMAERGARHAARADHLRVRAEELARRCRPRPGAPREIPDFDRVGASFISHDARDLAAPRVAALKAQGVPVLCWTIRSPEDETQARRDRRQHHLRGLLPPLPGLTPRRGPAPSTGR